MFNLSLQLSGSLLWYLFMMMTGSWWRHQMETFSALLTLCSGNSRSPMNSPHKGQWRGDLIFSLICAWLNDWVNNGEAGDFRRHRAHYDAIVMDYVLWNWRLQPQDYNVAFNCAFHELHTETQSERSRDRRQSTYRDKWNYPVLPSPVYIIKKSITYMNTVLTVNGTVPTLRIIHNFLLWVRHICCNNAYKLPCGIPRRNKWLVYKRLINWWLSSTNLMW